VNWACDVNASKRVITTPHAPSVRLSAPRTADTGPYRILVIGSESADVVRSVGGWICDRALSGWRVTVALRDTTDTEPIVILGAKPIPFEAFAQDLSNGLWPCALAIAADIFAEDSKVDRLLSSCRREDLPDVMVWGESPQAANAHLGDDEQHMSSRAARAFKAHALVAVGIPPHAAEDTELLHRVRLAGR